MAFVAAAAAVIGTAATIYGTVKAGQAQRESVDLQRKQQRNASLRSKRTAVRKAQIQRAQAIATSTGAGSSTGSGAAGGIGAIGSQLGGALGYANTQSALSGLISKQSERESFFSGIASIGSSFAQFGAAAGGFDFLKSGDGVGDLTEET